MTKIRYIGKKERRADTMYGTGLVWHGAGDVQSCEDPAKAKLLLRHTDMFEAVGEGAAPTPAPPPGVTLADGVLYGTDSLGASIILSDLVSVSLGDVVRSAYEESGLTVQAWNALAQPERDKLILTVVTRAKAFVAQAKVNTRAPAPDAAGQPAAGSQQGEESSTQGSAAGEAGSSAATGNSGSSGDEGGDGGGQGDQTVVYRMASENGPINLNNLDKDTLRRLAKSVNLTVSNNAGEDTLRRKLAEAFPVT